MSSTETSPETLRPADKLSPHWLARLFVATPLQPNDARTFRQGARERALGKAVRLRIFAAPLIGLVAATFAFFEASAWRRGVIATVVAVLFTLSYVEWARYRRHGTEAVGVTFNFLVMVTGQLGLITATGGLFSPLVPIIVVMGVIGAMVLDGPRPMVLVGGLALVTVWGLAIVHASSSVSLIPEIFGDAGTLERGPAPWIAASIYSLMVFASFRMGNALRATFERLFADSIRERDRVLEMHVDQTRTLSAFSAEIAHELKNPLASVKGLGALVAKDAEGKTGERVAVLRREVDRMQEILEELLTFSRPLVPLSMEEVDARLLADDVVQLHEGLAAERRVSLRLDAGPPARLRCDPRKVRQVLINLVQNAIDATQAGGEVHLEVRGDDDGVSFRVIDSGEGVRESIAERAFEPGVTSKDHGSGMGLAVARALARQHGGDLTLEDADGPGAVATLRLPRAVAEAAQ